MAKALLGAGVDPGAVHRQLYRDKSLEHLRLEANAIDRLRTTLDGRIAWTSLTEEMIATCEDPTEVSDLVEIPSSLAGVEVALLFKNVPGKRGTHVSLRGLRDFRVNRFAGRFGGGGHPTAAGCRIDETLDRAQALVLEELERELGNGS